ncbi:MAG: hypothetical protein VBE63_09895 [Lamprobacter sp.]|uniref:hypothetical protein n=1 Tax=Lamprobacter sp. TaxID=3100796 RepID=UPI002B25B701|nr:hypothetical protein [Lamprobacter sp.]MEA3640242.1 hypothetical protein [Lamprobacter sp.]
MLEERTFRTDGGTEANTAFMSTMQVAGLLCRVKKITCTDEGKLTMAIDATATDNEALERVRDLITIQQGEVMLTIEGTACSADQLQ